MYWRSWRHVIHQTMTDEVLDSVLNAAPQERRRGMTDADVIVVGAGGSGLAAAARCVECGLSVLVLEKQPQVGGTTGIAVGSFTANRTVQQRRADIVDTLDDHVEDAGRFAEPEIESRNNDSLRRFFLSHTATTLEWLTGLGLAFHGPSPEPPNRVPRMHNVVPSAKAYIAALQATVLRGGGQILCSAVVETLTRDGDRISGLTAIVDGQRQSFTGSVGVVLAAGDYANSTEMIARFKGGRYSTVEGINPHATGDGHRLAESAGACLLNMDVTYGPELRFVAPPARQNGFEQLLPASGFASRVAGKLLPFIPQGIVTAFIKRLLVTWQHPEDRLFDHGAMLINRCGDRFCDERVWPDRELAVARQPDKVAFIVLDHRLTEQYSRWPHFISTAPEIAYAYVADYLRLRPDVAVQASSLADAARLRDLPVNAVRHAVEGLNEQRNGTDLLPLTGDRWVLLGPLKAYFTTTEGGAAVNTQLEVLDESQQPIPGLYAIGQNGLGGQILWGHGLHIAWAMTSGRLVAEHLAAMKRAG
jgi:fumarate reductase flavoprotein subunit